ncbi:hypothetical protein ACJX0J_036335, partial [Zea mays]
RMSTTIWSCINHRKEAVVPLLQGQDDEGRVQPETSCPTSVNPGDRSAILHVLSKASPPPEVPPFKPQIVWSLKGERNSGSATSSGPRPAPVTLTPTARPRRPHATPLTTTSGRTTRPTAANQTGSQNNSNHSTLVPVKPTPKRRGRKPKRIVHKQLDIPDICDRLTSSVACEEILYCEEVKNQDVSEIDVLFDEIRPTVEEHKRDSQDSVSTSLAEKWIEASCRKYKAEFDLYAAILKNVASTPLRSKDDVAPRVQNGLKWVPPPLSSNRSPERENESTFAAGRRRIVEVVTESLTLKETSIPTKMLWKTSMTCIPRRITAE